MRNIFYFLAAILAFGAAWYYYQSVSAQTATINKLRLVAQEGLVIKAGTKIDDEFMEEYIVSQAIPRALAGEFAWALADNAVARVNLKGRTFAQDVNGGNFLQASQFFVAQESAFARRIKPGHRAFSIPVQSEHTLETFIEPGARVDVIGTFDTDDQNYYSKMLLENVEVMAVGEAASRGEYDPSEGISYSSVTLQAPSEVVAAFLGEFESSDGALTLVLRNPCDDNPDCVGGTAVAQ